MIESLLSNEKIKKIYLLQFDVLKQKRMKFKEIINLQDIKIKKTEILDQIKDDFDCFNIHEISKDSYY